MRDVPVHAVREQVAGSFPPPDVIRRGKVIAVAVTLVAVVGLVSSSVVLHHTQEQPFDDFGPVAVPGGQTPVLPPNDTVPTVPLATTPLTTIPVASAASDAEAEQSLRTVTGAAQSLYTGDGDTFGSAPGLAYRLSNGGATPGVQYSVGTSSAPTMVTMTTSADGHVLVLSASAGVGRCYYVEVNEEPAGDGGMAGSVTPTPGVSYAASGNQNATCLAGLGVNAGPDVPLTWGTSFPS